MVPPAPDARPSQPVASARIRTKSLRAVSVSEETEISGQRRRDRNPACLLPRSLRRTEGARKGPPMAGFWRRLRKTPFAPKCVVVSEGLELRARHAVISNRSRCSEINCWVDKTRTWRSCGWCTVPGNLSDCFTYRARLRAAILPPCQVQPPIRAIVPAQTEMKACVDSGEPVSLTPRPIIQDRRRSSSGRKNHEPAVNAKARQRLGDGRKIVETREALRGADGDPPQLPRLHGATGGIDPNISCVVQRHARASIISLHSPSWLCCLSRASSSDVASATV